MVPRVVVLFGIGSPSRPAPAGPSRETGIQFFPVAFQIAYRMDSRFRGNDCAGEHLRLAKDTTTVQGGKSICRWSLEL